MVSKECKLEAQEIVIKGLKAQGKAQPCVVLALDPYGREDEGKKCSARAKFLHP